MPSLYVKPLATSRALNLSIFSLESHFVLYTHLQSTILAPLGISFKPQTLLALIDLISSSIASSHLDEWTLLMTSSNEVRSRSV
jgi:hypothetical protein